MGFYKEEETKERLNMDIYEKHKSLVRYYKEQPTEEDLNSFINIRIVGTGYGTKTYQVKTNIECNNPFKALMCDQGNLCFGYRMEGDNIVVHTD